MKRTDFQLFACMPRGKSVFLCHTVCGSILSLSRTGIQRRKTRVGEEISSALIKQFLPGIGVPDSSELEEAYIQVKMKVIQQVYFILCFCLFQRFFRCQM